MLGCVCRVCVCWDGLCVCVGGGVCVGMCLRVCVLGCVCLGGGGCWDVFVEYVCVFVWGVFVGCRVWVYVGVCV